MRKKKLTATMWLQHAYPDIYVQWMNLQKENRRQQQRERANKIYKLGKEQLKKTTE